MESKIYRYLYYTKKGYIESKFEVGTVNTDGRFKGMYGGGSHRLFEIRRAIDGLLYYFPYEIYRLPEQSKSEYEEEIMKYARQRSSEIAYELIKETGQ